MLNELLHLDPSELVGKLLCTFVPKSQLIVVLPEIQRKFTILYGKIFVLESSDSDEYICTYNIDPTNISDVAVIDNTILCHRVKAHNVLYTLNALNTLIRKLNNGVQDPTYSVDWSNYRNSILLTRQGELVKINTKIKTIFQLDTLIDVKPLTMYTDQIISGSSENKFGYFRNLL